MSFMGVMANSYNSQKYSDKVMALMGIAIGFGRNRYGSGESLTGAVHSYSSELALFLGRYRKCVIFEAEIGIKNIG